MRHSLLVLVMLLALGLPANAQTGGVSGAVMDESGAVVPGATVTLSGPGVHQVAISGPKGEFSFANLRPNTYRLTVALAGFGEVTQDDITVGNADVEVPPITLSVAGLGETVVVSASKVESALINAPATMSVLSAEAIAASPAQNYGDLLRSVPGINVIQLSARDINLTSRQATSTLATSQLTLLDGRTIYLDFFGFVLWDFLPSNPQDIKQIEVVRGPASAVWGANALTGVVNIITKTPREAPGTTVTFTGGLLNRDAGSTEGRNPGSLFGASVTTAQAPNERWSYRISAGYFNSDAFPRPTGRIPLISDPRDPSKTVGGGAYPADRTGPLGTAFVNRGTTQPKFDVRVDQELGGGARLSYAGGVAGTEGIIHTGIGPFDIQPGSVLGYGRVSYTRGALRINFFTNALDGEAPNLLLPDPLTGEPLQLNFKTQTYDFEVGNSTAVGERHVFTYGGNARRNNFDITLAPAAEDRNEFGAYVQDEIFIDPFRFAIGGRVDKFGNLADPVFSPRLTAMVHPAEGHSVRVSFNRAFRSPSVVNNYLDVNIVVQTDLRGLAPLLPPPFQPLVLAPFPLVVKAVGSELSIGGREQDPLKEEALTAYEVAYTGTFRDRTTFGIAFFVNDFDDNINFSQLPANRDPYTDANPPPGWPLRGLPILTALAARGVYFPRTAFTYLNLGPTRQKGLELTLDHRFSRSLTAFANYSWQDDPEVLDDPTPFPTDELALPPTHRFNTGFNYNGPRFLGNASVHYSDGGFWSDVLTSPFHGFTDSYTLVNATFGIKWVNGKVVTSVKTTNLTNEDITQHVFGDILKRQVVGEVRLSF